MFDYLRNLTKSSEEKRQELLTGYADGELSAREQQQFEAMMAQDDALQREAEQLQMLRQQLRRTPRRRVPRNFTLDPQLYGAPDPQPLFRLYPVLQTATILAAVMLFFVLGLDLLGGGFSASDSAEPVAQVEVTRVVTETVVEEVAEAEAIEVQATQVVETEMATSADDTAQDKAVGADKLSDEPASLESATQNQFLDAEATIEPLPTASPAPTATISSSPREAAEPDFDTRALGTAVARSPAEGESATENLYSLVVTPTSNREQLAAPAPSPWLSWQIGLAVVFVLLLILTLIVRQRIR